jgi:hypothetical protein
MTDRGEFLGEHYRIESKDKVIRGKVSALIQNHYKLLYKFTKEKPRIYTIQEYENERIEREVNWNNINGSNT